MRIRYRYAALDKMLYQLLKALNKESQLNYVWDNRGQKVSWELSEQVLKILIDFG